MTTQETPSATDPVAHIGSYQSIADILAVFRPVMHAMAMSAGPGCEVVLHDLSDPDPDLGHTIVAIENGHVTGRDVGGPSSSLGASVLHDQSVDHNAFGYEGLTSDGRQLRCSSIYFRDTAGAIIAALCVNYDVSTLEQARTLLDNLLTPISVRTPDRPKEFFGQDLVEVMDGMIAEALREVGKPVGQMNRADRVAIFKKLDAQGALQMRKGVETVALRLGISRVTAYSYLDETRNGSSVERSS